MATRSGEGQGRASCVVWPPPILCALCQERSESMVPKKPFCTLFPTSLPLAWSSGDKVTH